jgi:hypothetical protein
MATKTAKAPTTDALAARRAKAHAHSERAKYGTVTAAEQAMLAQEQAETFMAAADALVTPDLSEAVVELLTPKAADVDADGFAVIDSKATFVAYDPKGKRPFKLHCADCSKPIMRADRAPGHKCFACIRAGKARPAKVAAADAAEAKNVAAVAAPKTRKATQNPRVLANRMVTARAKAIADRSKADA